MTQKAKYDETGGNAIREASMVGMRRTHSEAELTDDSSDIENQPLTVRAKKSKSKRQRHTLSKQSSEGPEENFAKVFERSAERSEKQRNVHQREMIEALHESSQVYEKMQEKTLAALLKLAE